MKRRNVLRNAAVAGISALGLASAASAESPSKSIVKIKRSAANPITQDDIERALQTLRVQASEEQTKGSVLPKTGPNLAPVAYIAHVRSDGMIESWMGTAPVSGPQLESSAGIASEMHAELDEKEEEFLTPTISTQAVSGYHEMTSHVTTYGSCAGKFTQTSILYQHDDYDRRFVTKERNRVIPGAEVTGCNNNTQWTHDSGYNQHDWTLADPNVQVTDQKPGSVQDGNTTYSATIGYDGGSVGVSYDPPDVYMYPGGGVTDADWDWTINSGNASTQTYEVASSALMGSDPDYLEIICEDHAEWNYSTFGDSASYSGTHTLRYG